jgi:flagellar protein FlaJ
MDIIFFIFIGIMVVMQYKILPLTSGVGSIAGIGSGGIPAVGIPSTNPTDSSPEQLARPFLFMLIVQGFFTGLTVGKLAEGSIKEGIKHSFILSVIAFLVSSGAKAFIG